MQLTTKLALAFSLAGGLAACGNNGNGTTDAPGTGIDAPGTIAPCGYTETADATNNTTAEISGLTIGALSGSLCGQIDGGRFDPTSKTVDVDSYTVAVSGTAELIVQFENDTPASLTDFQVAIFDTAADPTLLNAGDYNGSLGDHGAYLAELPAGNYNVVVSATALTDIAAAIPYKVHLIADQPTTRCADLTGMPVDYAEANDGASNTGNDVMLVDFSKNPSFTMTTSTPEPTALTVDPTKTFHITGSSATVAAGTDKYLDRDTYLIATGAATNELSIRLDWPGSTADLDYVVFEANTLKPNVAATLTATTKDEFATFAVKPSTSYWVWIGAYKGSTGTPIAYDAAVCGGQFTP